MVFAHNKNKIWEKVKDWICYLLETYSLIRRNLEANKDVLQRMKRRLKMIKKWYEVSCDLCGNGLNHYAELKPTCTDLRRDGIKVKINNGKVFVFCKECYEKIKKETKK